MCIAKILSRRLATVTIAALLGVTTLVPVRAAEPEKLNIAVATAAVIYGPVWVALAENLFEKNGVKVNVVSTAALQTGSAMLVSGQTDLIVTTAFLGLRIATEGNKPLSYVLNISNMGTRVNAFIARPDIKSMEQLAAMGEKCKIIVLPPGTGGWALLQGVLAKYKLKCAVSTAGSIPNVLAGVVTSQFDAGFVNPQDAYGAAEQGKATILLDPLKISDADAEAIYPYRHPFSTVFGLRANLQSKREAVVRFVRALREANERIAKMTPEQLGKLAKGLPDVFASTPETSLAMQWKIQEGLFPHGPTAGYITEGDWNTLIRSAPAVWGFANLDPNDPRVSFANNVDMSYFNAAAPRP